MFGASVQSPRLAGKGVLAAREASLSESLWGAGRGSDPALDFSQPGVLYVCFWDVMVFWYDSVEGQHLRIEIILFLLFCRQLLRWGAG